MTQVIVRYKVKPERAAENVELVRAVYEELRDKQPDGLNYATFQLDDRVSFVHVAAHADGPSPLLELEAFKRFQQNIRDRCEEPPVVSSVNVIGSYRVFADGNE
jgi:hypothetical protein